MYHLLKCPNKIDSDLQVSNRVSFSQLHLEHFQATDISSETGQTLFTATTHSNEQSIASRRLKYTVDATTIKDR